MPQDVLASSESQVHEMLVAWILREVSLGQHSELVCSGVRAEILSSVAGIRKKASSMEKQWSIDEPNVWTGLVMWAGHLLVVVVDLAIAVEFFSYAVGPFQWHVVVSAVVLSLPWLCAHRLVHDLIHPSCSQLVDPDSWISSCERTTFFNLRYGLDESVGARAEATNGEPPFGEDDFLRLTWQDEERPAESNAILYATIDSLTRETLEHIHTISNDFQQQRALPFIPPPARAAVCHGGGSGAFVIASQQQNYISYPPTSRNDARGDNNTAEPSAGLRRAMPPIRWSARQALGSERVKEQGLYSSQHDA